MYDLAGILDGRNARAVLEVQFVGDAKLFGLISAWCRAGDVDEPVLKSLIHDSNMRSLTLRLARGSPPDGKHVRKQHIGVLFGTRRRARTL